MAILLPQPLECQNWRCEPPCPAKNFIYIYSFLDTWSIQPSSLTIIFPQSFLIYKVTNSQLWWVSRVLVKHTIVFLIQSAIMDISVHWIASKFLTYPDCGYTVVHWLSLILFSIHKVSFSFIKCFRLTYFSDTIWLSSLSHNCWLWVLATDGPMVLFSSHRQVCVSAPQPHQNLWGSCNC